MVWLVPIAILLSACIGAFVAVHAIGTQQKIARKRATLDLLSRKEWDNDFVDAKRRFNRLRDSGEDIGVFATAARKQLEDANFDMIRNILNDYELIAVGIAGEILDEDLYKLWFRSALVKDYEKSRGFIVNIRKLENVPEYYSEFEVLAKRWGAKDNQ